MMAVAALLFLHLAGVLIWQKIHPSFLLFDSAGYYALTLRLHDFMINIIDGVPLSFFAEWRDIGAMMKWHGCFTEMATAVFYFIFGRGENVTVLIADALFGGTLLFSVYAIGKKWHSRACGVLAAFLLSFTPLFFDHLRAYMLDIPLTAMVTLTFYLSWPLDSWKRTRRAYVTGIVMACGFLIKANFILFIAPLLGFIFFQSLRLRDASGGRMARNIVVAVALTAAISGIFYVFKFRDVASRIYETSYGRAFCERVFSSWGMFASELIVHAAVFLRSFALFALSPVFSIALLLAFPSFLRSSLKREEKILLCLSVGVPLGVFAFVFRVPPHHMTHMIRYALPVLPFLSLITAVGFLSCRRPRFLRAAIGPVFCLGAAQLFMPFYFFGETASLVFSHVLPGAVSPSHKEVQDILDKISALEREEEAFEILFLDHLPQVCSPLESRVMRNRFGMRIKRLSFDTERPYQYRSIFPSHDDFLSADYVALLKYPFDGGLEFLEEWQAHQAVDAREAFENRRADFALIRDWPFGSGNRLLIFKNQAKVRTVAVIRRGALKFTFDRGRGRIFWRDREVTSGVGLFASFVYEGVKHDSFDAVWDVEKIDDRQISLTGRWVGSLLRQHWEITLIDDGVMDWRIFLKAPDGKIWSEDFGIMLVDEYASWFVPGQARGQFHETRRRFLKHWRGAIAAAKRGIACRGSGDVWPDVIFQAVSARPALSYLIFSYNEIWPGRGLACFRFNADTSKQTDASPRYEVRMSFAE